MKHRSLIAILSALVLLLTFVACGSKTGEEASSATSTEATGVIAPDAGQVNEVPADQTLESSASETLYSPSLAFEDTTAATTTAKVTTTKAATTTKAPVRTDGKTKWEISAAGITAPIAGAKVLRAWNAKENGVAVEAYRLEYGAKHETWGSSGSANSAVVQPVITVAVIHASPDHFYSTTSNQALGKPLATVEQVADKVEPLIGVNIAYWLGGTTSPRFVVDCPVVVGGKIVQAGTISWPSLNIYKDGTWEYATISPENVNDLLAKGLVFNVVDQHVPIQGGERTYSWGNGNGNGGDNEPYGFFGQIDKNTYVIATGEFMNRNDMVDVLLAYGVQTVVEINGGNSAMLYLKGVGNAPNPTSDGKSLQGLNKLNLTDNEHQYLLGIFGGEGKGGTNATIDFVYFK
ncbi:MAG: hypothetical protein LBS96_05805 [Oscillospiraceae bacterium]|jgi:hypothetical protein|nr:hypothetical protein [Oscillospiraceae bacterium]